MFPHDSAETDQPDSHRLNQTFLPRFCDGRRASVSPLVENVAGEREAQVSQRNQEAVAPLGRSRRRVVGRNRLRLPVPRRGVPHHRAPEIRRVDSGPS